MCSFQGTGDNSFFYKRIEIRNSMLFELSNGDKEIRTPDPLLARQVLSQLSYTPMLHLM